ncbi:MAG: helix-turn-helix domain-containing protein [Pseudonocardiaceae bacterium]
MSEPNLTLRVTAEGGYSLGGVTLPAVLIDPGVWGQQEMRAALAVRDIGEVYRTLTDLGVSQRQIATLAGQSQSEVSEIIKGRVVKDYRLLERIAEGLGIPRELMGLSWWAADGSYAGQDETYAGEVTVAETPEGVSADMLRRHVLALGATAAFVPRSKALGELLDLPRLVSAAPLPSRILPVHVAQVRDLTQLLGVTGKAHGPDPEVSSAAAASATRLLKVPGAEPIKQALMAAVAELHIHAGWASSDAGLYHRAMIHYARALGLASDAGDAYLQAHALTLAGFATVEHGHPNDGLKMQQLAQVKAWQIPSADPRGVAVQAWAKADSATAYAALGEDQAAYRELTTARELWQPSRTDPTGDLDGVAALLEVERGRLDVAEPFAVSSVRRWDGLSRLGNTRSSVTLATIHIRAGEGDGLQLAHNAINAVSKLSSMRARKRLEPLADALDTRSGSDARGLARMARQVATTRA